MMVLGHFWICFLLLNVDKYDAQCLFTMWVDLIVNFVLTINCQ